MNNQHGGDIYGEHKIILDFSVNTNPLGMPESVRDAVIRSAECWERYPDPLERDLKKAASSYYGAAGCPLPERAFLFGNGASDLLYSLIFARRPKRALITAPSFLEYEKALSAVGTDIQYLSLNPERNFSLEAEWDALYAALTSETYPELVILTNPNNPDGRAVSAGWMRQAADLCRERDILLVVDECFHWFLEDWKQNSLLPILSGEPERYSHVVVINALTKIFSMAGLRLGFLTCTNPALPEAIERVRQPWSVSAPAKAAGLAAFQEKDFIRRSAAYVKQERIVLSEELKKMGFTVYPSAVNYLLIRKAGGDETDYAAACRNAGILIRRCGNFKGLDESYYRVAVRKREENEQLLRRLREAGR